MNERDEHGWRVPRPGTHSRYIYDAMLCNRSNKEIAKALSISPSTVGVLKYKIRNPTRSNERELANYKKKKGLIQ